MLTISLFYIAINTVREPKVCEQIYKPIKTYSSLMPKQLQKTD